MIAGFNVIVENPDYLLWGRTAAGEPGGVLLSLLMAAGAALLALPGGVALACLARRYLDWCAGAFSVGGVDSRYSPDFCDFLDVVPVAADHRRDLPGR